MVFDLADFAARQRDFIEGRITEDAWVQYLRATGYDDEGARPPAAAQGRSARAATAARPRRRGQVELIISTLRLRAAPTQPTSCAAFLHHARKPGTVSV
jgi:hypothetical protein